MKGYRGSRHSIRQFNWDLSSRAFANVAVQTPDSLVSLSFNKRGSGVEPPFDSLTLMNSALSSQQSCYDHGDNHTIAKHGHKDSKVHSITDQQVFKMPQIIQDTSTSPPSTTPKSRLVHPTPSTLATFLTSLINNDAPYFTNEQ